MRSALIATRASREPLVLHRYQCPLGDMIAIAWIAAVTASSTARCTSSITRGRIDPETRAYLQRKEAEGKSRIEAMRCLKRHLARRYYRLLSERSRSKGLLPVSLPPVELHGVHIGHSS